MQLDSTCLTTHTHAHTHQIVTDKFQWDLNAAAEVQMTFTNMTQVSFHHA